MKSDAEFNKLANSYDNWHGELIKGSGFDREYFLEYKVKETARVLAKLGVKPKNILDFGCGVGDVEPYLQKYFPEAAIFAVDISADSIETAKEKVASISFAALGEDWIRDESLAQFGASFDLVFIAGVLHHAPPYEHDEILTAVKKQMSDGGWIFIFELNPYNPATRHVFSKYEKPVDRNANLIQGRRVKGILRGLGFCDLRTVYTIFFPHFLRAFIPLEKFLRCVPFGAHYYIYGRV